MTLPDIKIIHDSQHEAARVAGTYLDLKKNFFQFHQFHVLPRPEKGCVYLPDIDYSLLENFNIPSTYHRKEISLRHLTEISKQLKSPQHEELFGGEILKKAIKEVMKSSAGKIGLLFPKLSVRIKNINVILTAYGTEGSFDYKMKNGRYELYIWLRNTGVNEAEVSANFLHCLLSVFVLIQTGIPDSTDSEWNKREAIVDFLQESVFGMTGSATLKSLESKQKKSDLAAESEVFLRKLELASDPVRVLKTEKGYEIEGRQLAPLTLLEEKLLDILLENKNFITSKEVIYDHLYTDLSGSDWSVSKILERLRKKIRVAGFNYPLIKTYRNKGYTLEAL